MGVLILLGTSPEQARRLPAHLVHRIVEAASASRDDVAAFLDAASGGDESAPLTLAVDHRTKEERRRGRR